MPDLLAALLAWTLTHTPYHATGQPTLLLTPAATTELRGWYQGGMIMITDVPAAKPDNVRFRALVVHEITHWLQDKSGKFADDCPTRQKLEAEAYSLQRRYLLAHGVRPGPAPIVRCAS